ncbi:choice-of-anchor L domain-containing protein [Winogradskyella litorisediminis]|uniref:Choice-of-anchor L domain-containing protein n=1 Tax=Winogradskyella litorisediminis TaxID=1156618 RepID=A0ABW3NA50_9FLAO
MKNRYTFFIFFSLCSFLGLSVFAQQITVDDNLTPNNLVENTIQSECIIIENVQSQVNGSVVNINSFGFFERGNSNFPFANGMVLTTGSATSAGNGENTDELNEGDSTWTTDSDLENALGITETLNATSIEFDFTSISNTLQFNYILASEEYFSNFSCQYSDGFAFLIREAGTNDPYQNIALIPGNGSPVNTMTIRPNIEGFCEAQNEEFFAGFNLGDTNYNGRTTVMTATANITPNVAYHIKLVIADQTDRNYDSAVFIEADSFIPTVNLGNDFSSCANTVTLDGDINNPDAQYQWYLNNLNIDGATQPTFEASESGTYRVEINIPLGNVFCTIDDEIEIELSSTQSATPMTDFELCDDLSNDGVETFNLALKNAQAINSVPPGNYTVTYHTSLPDAQNGDNPVAGNYQNQVNPQLIYVRIEDNNSGCLAFNQFQLVVNSRPEATQPPLMQVCDDEVADGITTINLNENDDIITNGQTGLVVTYHSTQADATNNSNALPMPYVNINPTETVFISVTNPASGCNTTTSLDIEVLDAPELNDAEPYYIDACDPEYDGFAEFDLTSVEADILNGLTNVTVTYHTSQQDAESGDNPISNPTNFENTTQTEQIIFIRVVDNSTGCANTLPIEIHSNLLLSEPDFSDSILCDIDGDNSEAFNLAALASQIIGDIPDITIAFFETEDDRTSGINELDQAVDYFPPNTPQTLYLTLTSPTCTEVEEIILGLQSIEQFPDLPQQTVCDSDQDGIRNFNLSEYNEQLTEGQTGYTITYFETQQDADDNTNPLPTIYENTTNPFTVFARITSNETSCADTSSFEILVNPAPETSSPTPIVICDDDLDGFFIVNLEDKISEITTSTADTSITFFTSVSNANTNTDAIENPEAYNAQTSIIVARVENTITGCVSLENISITVNTLPVFTEISDFNFCENNTDNVGEFLLRTKDNEILNGQTGKEVLYFLTPEDAETGNNPIDKNSNFENTENPQTIYVRVQNITDANCYGTDSFVLNVGINPIFNEPIDMFVCDDGTNDTFAEINLDEKTAEISEGIAENLIVTYYRNFGDFQNQTNPITENTFTNTTNPQEIFVTIANGTICTSEASFTINVVPVPNVSTIQPFEDCDVDYDESIIWDLTQAEINILDVRQNNIEVTYFLSEEDAEADINQISNPENFENTSNPQTVYVKVINTDFNCPITLPIELNVISPPLHNDFGAIEICDNDDNSYDLSLIDELVVDDANGISISYYTTEQDAINSENEISNNYTYQTNNDIIYTRIQDNNTNCYFVYPFMLVINERPTANMPNDLEDCDDDTDGQLIFDLEAQNEQIIGNQNDTFLEVSYYNTEVEAINNVNALESFYNASNNETIYARVTNTQTQCFSLTQFNIIINPLPFANIQDQSICLENSPLIVDANTGNNSDTYLWSTGEITPSIEIETSGSYSVTITTENGCVATTEFNTVVSESANIEVVETVDFSDPNNITITVSGIGDYLFQLDDGALQDNGFFENVTLGYHTLTIFDRNGCSSVTKEVLVIDAPKFMTPNNDGAFDTWHIIGVEALPGTIVYIFDRYGKLLKQLNHTSSGWDGTYNGNPMPTSDYWWSAEVKRGDIQFTAQGHFALKR